MSRFRRRGVVVLTRLVQGTKRDALGEQPLVGARPSFLSGGLLVIAAAAHC
jgi:hypothetical protein